MALFKKKADLVAEPPVLLAAASNLRVATYRDSMLVALQRQPWQYKALDMYEDEGHTHFASGYIGSAMSRIRLVAAKKPEDPREDPVEITEGPVYEAVLQLGSGRSGQKGLLRLLGIHLFLVGECWLLGTLMPTGQPRWEVLSIQELTVLPGDPLSLYRKRLPGATPEPIPKDALIMRIWREHPRYTELADSGFRPLLDLLEKIILLNRAEKAAARSRSASMGVLVLSQDLIPPPQQNQESVSDVALSSPFMTAFTQAMIAPLSDEGHPGSVVPIVLVASGDIDKKLRFESMTRPFEASIRQSITDAIEQVAHGLDIPPETLTGLGNLPRVSAWQIKEETFQAHIQPLIELVCDALTQVYLRPSIERVRAQLIADGELEEDLDRYIIWYDTRELIIRPDKGDKAIALHDRFAISNAALRRENGFLESDAVGELEYSKRIGIKLADANLAITGKTPPDQVGIMKKQADIQTEQAKDQLKMQEDAAKRQMELQQQMEQQASGEPAPAEPAPADEQTDTTAPPNPPQAPQGAAVEPARSPGRPKETVQPDSYHTPQGKHAKPRPQAQARRKKPEPPTSINPPVIASAAQRRLAVSGSFSQKLGYIDVMLIKKVQKLANEAVRESIKLHNVTAGASAQDLIGNTKLLADNKAAVEAALYRAYQDSFRELNAELADQGLTLYSPEVIATTIADSIDGALAHYEDVLYKIVNDQLFHPIDLPAVSAATDLVLPGDIRQVVQAAGGGGVSADFSNYVGGVSTGAVLQSILQANGAPIEGWLWLYDFEFVRRNFMGHRQLDGFVFQEWDDEELTVTPFDQWIQVPFYFPGDHTGCGCVVVPWTGADWTGGHSVAVESPAFE